MSRYRDAVYIVALALLLLLVLFRPAESQIPSGEQGPGGQGPSGMTCTTTGIPASSTTVTLVAPSSYITIANLSAVQTVYFSPVNPATTSSFAIQPGSAYSYQGSPLTSFWVIGTAASDQYSVLAH